MNVAKLNNAVILENEPREKLWNKNFFLLWQGQLVSALGDQAYVLALGFWIMATTGSTAIMGTLMAASTIPRVLISPFSGVIVDRIDRKQMIIWTDLIRGILVTIIGIGAYRGFLEIWMVFFTGVILRLCGAFFGPSVQSAIPDIVPKSKLVPANSLFQIIHSSTQLIGNVASGVLYALVGAPFLFLFNGISYLFSAGTESFIDIPKIERKEEKKITFIQDFVAGLNFVWKFTSLRNLFITASVSNFFSSMSFVLLIPLFTLVRGFDSAQYGFAMGAMALGMFLGMGYTSIRKIKPEGRYKHFLTGGILSFISFSTFPFMTNIYLVSFILLVAGIGNALVNVFIGSIVQMTTPAEMRGKVFGLLGTLSQGLTPIAMALGGVLGVFIPIPYIFLGTMILSFVCFIPVVVSTAFKRFMNFNPDVHTLQDVI